MSIEQEIKVMVVEDINTMGSDAATVPKVHEVEHPSILDSAESLALQGACCASNAMFAGQKFVLKDCDPGTPLALEAASIEDSKSKWAYVMSAISDAGKNLNENTFITIITKGKYSAGIRPDLSFP